MQFVQKIRRQNGELQLYLRKKGLPSIRLKSPLPAAGEEAGSALEREVKGLLERFQAAKPLPGTLAQALTEYESEDADFLGLAASTQYEYGLILRELKEDFGVLPITSFTPAYVLKLRDTWAKRGHRCANVRRQVLKNVLKRSVIAGQLERDPFALVGGARRPADAPEPHILWPASVVRTVIEAAIADKKYGLARAVAIGRYVGARRGDLVALLPSARQSGRFQFLSGKKKIPVDQVEDPALTYWLSVTPATQPATPRPGRKVKAGDNVVRLPARTLVFNLANERYTEDGLGLELAKLVRDLHAEQLLDRADYDLHGLRHTRGVEAALAGATDAQGAALMGHGSPNSFAQYRRQANRIRLSDDASAKIAALRESSVEQEVEQRCNSTASDAHGA